MFSYQGVIGCGSSLYVIVYAQLIEPVESCCRERNLLRVKPHSRSKPARSLAACLPPTYSFASATGPISARGSMQEVHIRL
jgi:hypothetical protein